MAKKKKNVVEVNQQVAENIMNELKEHTKQELDNLIGSIGSGNSVLINRISTVTYCRYCGEVQELSNGLDKLYLKELEKIRYTRQFEFTCPCCQKKSHVYEDKNIYAISTLGWNLSENVMVSITSSSEYYPLVSGMKVTGFKEMDLLWFLEYKKSASVTYHFLSGTDHTNYLELYHAFQELEDGIETENLVEYFTMFTSPEEKVVAYLAIKYLPRAYDIIINAPENVKEVFYRYLTQVIFTYSCYVNKSYYLYQTERLFKKLRLLINPSFDDYNEIFHVPFNLLKDVKDLDMADSTRRMMKKVDMDNNGDILVRIASLGSKRLTDNVRKILNQGYTKPEKVYGEIIVASLLTGLKADTISSNIADYQLFCRKYNVPYDAAAYSVQSIYNIHSVCNCNKYHMSMLLDSENTSNVHEKWYEDFKKIADDITADKILFLENGDLAELVYSVEDIIRYTYNACISTGEMFKFIKEKSAYLYVSATSDVLYVIDNRDKILLERNIA